MNDVPDDIFEKAEKLASNYRWGPLRRELSLDLQAMLLSERKETIERCAKVAERYFTGMFTGWIGYSSESLITLDEAEGAAVECGPICAAAIRSLGRE